MKILKYVFVMLFLSTLAISCTENAVEPQRGDEDDPIVVPPPPIKTT